MKTQKWQKLIAVTKHAELRKLAKITEEIYMIWIQWKNDEDFNQLNKFNTEFN